MIALVMFGPHREDTVSDLQFKVSMINAFGQAGVGTEAERDAAVGALRQAIARATIREHASHGFKSHLCELCNQTSCERRD